MISTLALQDQLAEQHAALLTTGDDFTDFTSSLENSMRPSVPRIIARRWSTGPS
jgi:hypothetical protein